MKDSTTKRHKTHNCLIYHGQPIHFSFYIVKLDGVYQTSQKLIAKHLMKSCVRIPEATRQELFRLRRRGVIFKTSPEGGGKKYWASQMARNSKVIETEHGLIFGPDVPNPNAAVATETNDTNDAAAVVDDTVAESKPPSATNVQNTPATAIERSSLPATSGQVGRFKREQGQDDAKTS